MHFADELFHVFGGLERRQTGRVAMVSIISGMEAGNFEKC